MTFEKHTVDERKKYVEWCKIRAREYLEIGDHAQAVASMISDMNARDDCRVSMALSQLGLLYLINGSTEDIKRFIEGFN